ncbi:Rossmann-like and DUF2520 domain-containing protein [Compostibacter hankyongensis]|uniref:DUF2520 domain-containing protein n=1 Tax=Compostibacter hankyongensis TaxID=1007089 RepID=A0ABP8FVX0_9BACT
MDIVIIGSGNVAHCFSHRLQLNGHQIRQVISRNREHARELAEQLNTPYSDDLLDIDMNADVYLIAIQDDAIPAVNQELRLGKRIVAHTAGAVPLDAIRNISVNTGVIYPLQSLRREMREVEKIPLLLEAANEMTLRRLGALAEALSEQVVTADSEKRLQLHLAAVLSNNFTNHLIARCEDYCEKRGLDFGLLRPILHETFQRIERNDARQVQTGPAYRNDVTTLELHRGQLKDNPDLLQLYEVLSNDIRQFYDVERKAP